MSIAKKEFYYLVSIVGSLAPPLSYKSNCDIENGTFVKVSLRGKIKDAMILSKMIKPSFRCLEIEYITDFYLPAKYQEIIKFMCKYYVYQHGEILKLFIPFKINKLDLISERASIKDIPPYEYSNQLNLFLEKYKRVLLILDEQRINVYINLFHKFLKKNQTSLLLMPDIISAKIVSKKLKKYFKNIILVWHYRLNKQQKDSVLTSLYDSTSNIVVGVMSALFLPMRNLKLIIVDNEQEDSYKSLRNPRYNAKDMALYFSKTLDINLLLATQSPSYESWAKYPHINLLKSKVDKDNFIFKSLDEVSTIEYIKEYIEEMPFGSSVLVMVPTKGAFRYLFCKECNKSIKCKTCLSNMIICKDALYCSACRNYQKILNRCPYCGSKKLSLTMMGAKRVYDELSSLKQCKVALADKDHIKTPTMARKTLQAFSKGDINILVGTWMLNKSYIFKNVSLVVILNIDFIFYQLDYKARQKCLDIVQKSKEMISIRGKIIINTKNVDFFKKYINSYENFLSDETNYIKELYPPKKKLLKLTISHANKAVTQSMLKIIKSDLSSCEKAEILFISQYSQSKKVGLSIVLRSKEHSILAKIGARYKSKFCNIDIDPVSLL